MLTEAGFVPVYGGEDYSDTPVGTILQCDSVGRYKSGKRDTSILFCQQRIIVRTDRSGKTAETMNRRYRQGIYKICKVKL